VKCRLIYTRRAVRDIDALDPATKNRIGKTLLRYEKDPLAYAELTFPRFHRHLYKEEQDEIGGQDEHQDQTAVYGRV
jgi:hypothetical protein